MTKTFLATCAFLPLALAATKARADDVHGEPAADHTEPAAVTVVGDVGLGASDGKNDGGYIVLDTTLRAQFARVLEAGVAVDGGSVIFGPSYLGYGALAGVHLDVAGSQLHHFTIHVLADAGYHHYSGVGSGLFEGPGASASMPYVGGRLGVVYGFGTWIRLDIGLWGIAQYDLERVHTTVEQPGFFGDSTTTKSVTIGDDHLGVVGTIGFSIAL